MTSRALALLAAFASPVFMVAAIAGWLSGLWPANELTFGVSALLVVSGPVLGIVHVATAREAAPPAVAPVAVASVASEPVPLTPRAARARAFHNWRSLPHPAIERRERERRASRHLRS